MNVLIHNCKGYSHETYKTANTESHEYAKLQRVLGKLQRIQFWKLQNCYISETSKATKATQFKHHSYEFA